jgi:polysaccharide chain length determinant protein (PEP-CTERM system associated)
MPAVQLVQALSLRAQQGRWQGPSTVARYELSYKLAFNIILKTVRFAAVAISRLHLLEVFDMADEPEGDIGETSNIGETLDRFRCILIRRRRWIVGIGVGVALGTVGALSLLPNRYISEATLLVVQQQVPERYVVPTSTTDISAALQAMKREVLSRTRLLKIVQDFNLYEKKRRRLAPETVTELMLKDIDIEPIDENPVRKDFTAFKISFIAESPALAQRVTNTLTYLFISENLRTREEQSVNTTAFLHEQVEEKRKTLEERERTLRDLKMHFLGELPEQQQGNLGILTGLQAQLQNTLAALNHAQEQRVYLESLLNGYLTQPMAELSQLRAKRAKLLEVYTPQYPAVVKIDQDIEKAEAFLRGLQEDRGGQGKEGYGTAAPAGITEQPAIAQVKSQLDANRVEIMNLSKEEARLKNAVAEYERRLNATPAREQQLLTANRDLEQLQQEYAELQKKEEESRLATNLEKNQGGQQFRLVDPPSLPVVPSTPKRLKVSVGGVAAGFGLGLAIALLIEMKDRSLHTEADVIRQFSPPLVLAVPMVLTSREKHVRFWGSAAELAAGAISMALVCLAEFYVYRKG